MTTTCRWNGSTSPRLLRSHLRDCESAACPGCQPCTEGAASRGGVLLTGWENEGGPRGAGNTNEGLTHSSDVSREGLGMNPTPKCCDAPDCENLPRTTGSKWCEKHYSRLRKHGQLDLPPNQFNTLQDCAAEGCERRAKTKGYCGKHWERIRKHGDPTVALLIHGDPQRRFWTHVEKTEGCWLWTGSLTYDGYALFRVGSERTGAHRWSWIFANGPIPDGMQLDHLCRVRNCVRPDHLEVVTPAENTRRAWGVRR